MRNLRTGIQAQGSWAEILFTRMPKMRGAKTQGNSEVSCGATAQGVFQMGQLKKLKKRLKQTYKMPIIGNPLLNNPLFTGIKPTAVIGKSIVAPPGLINTATFTAIGKFDTREEAINCQKYIHTKFARTMLSMLKVTQHNAPQAWAFVPMQDFTANSDIDWSGSLEDIDRQLYKKYKLNWQEILFIESRIKYGVK